MKVGDLLRSRDKLHIGVVRIYTDDQCDSWETHMRKEEVVLRVNWRMVEVLLGSGTVVKWAFGSFRSTYGIPT